MNKHYYSLLVVLGASLFLSLLYCPPYDLGMSDKEIFTYTGWAIHQGQVPYLDFFDHKPPLIFFINYAGILLGGPWGLWLINTTLALLVTFLLFNRCRQYRLPFPWLLPLLFNLMLRDNLISEGTNLTREYTAFFFLFFFCTLIGESRYRHYLLGLWTGLIFFTQQDQALPLIPFLIYALLANPQPKSIFQFIAGFTTITLPILIYFTINGALHHFWDQAFLFNLKVYTTEKKSIGDHFRSIKRVLDSGNYELPFIIALCLGVTSLTRKHKRKGLVLAALAGLFLTLSPELMGGRTKGLDQLFDYYYYYLPLSASICVLLFTVFAFTDEPLLRNPIAWIPWSFLLCASLTYTALQHATHLSRRDQDPILAGPELKYLKSHPPVNRQLYIFREEDYTAAYYEFRILSPSRWIYQHFWSWYDNWDSDGILLQSIESDLLKYHTTYLIMPPIEVISFRNKTNQNQWLDFVKSHYDPLPLEQGKPSNLWKLKEGF
ncbi:MAG: hypothetical protein JST68_26675 [Bacteroidetes bacterium]|nr:hypothetical protein [Bacteroidota bacterium]